MRITGYENEIVILKELGDRIKEYRITLNITQSELAEKCGISTSTEKRIENGDDVKLSNVIRVMMGLGIAENLDILIPEGQPSFKAIFEKKPTRKRARQVNDKKGTTWVWGEDKKEVL